jgi:hypothetical protein
MYLFIDHRRQTLHKKLGDLQVPGIPTSSSGLSESVRHLKNIPDPVLRARVIQYFARSVSEIWLVDTPIIGFCLFLCEYLEFSVFQTDSDIYMGLQHCFYDIIR